MKKVLLIAFAAMAVCLTSCKKEEPAPKPDYRDDAFEVCKGYLNQNGEAVVKKLYEDWNGDRLVTAGESRFFKAKYEEIEVFVDENTHNVYKVKYKIGLPDSDRAKANNYANNFNQKVSAFYTTDKKENYSIGRVYVNDQYYISNKHDEFLQLFNAHVDDYSLVEEEWGKTSIFGMCQKTWQVEFLQDTKELFAKFSLDIG